MLRCPSSSSPCCSSPSPSAAWSSLRAAWLGAALLVLAGCAGGRGTAIRDLAARETGCPAREFRVQHLGGHDYRATGCGETVDVVCTDPYESTGAQKGAFDGTNAAERLTCDTIYDRKTGRTVNPAPEGEGDGRRRRHSR